MSSSILSVLASVSLLTTTSLDAQSRNSLPSQPPRPNHAFLEIAGTAGDASINYERSFANNSFIRLGYGTDWEGFGFCTGIGFIIGCSGNREAELGLALAGYKIKPGKADGTFRNVIELAAGIVAGEVTSTEESFAIFTPSTTVVTKDQVLAAALVIAYRRNLGSRGILRFGFTPLIRLNDAPLPEKEFDSRFGLSLGLAF